ncbi:hypothetical protein BGZ46_003001, partial [Entomortierella lignicola]
MEATNRLFANKAKASLQMLVTLMLPILIFAQLPPGVTTTTITTTVTVTTTTTASPTCTGDSDYILYRDARAVSLTWERIVGGYILIIIGTYLALRGFRYYRVTIFLSGFLGGALIIYSIFLNVTPNRGWNHQQIIYLFSMIGGGLVFGILCFIFNRYAMWTVSGLSFFVIALYILSWREQGLIHKKGGRIALLVGCTVLGMVLGLLVGRRLIIPCSAIVGAYVAVMGVDFFARTGILIAISRFLKTDPLAYYRVTANTYVMLGILGGAALLSIVYQYFSWRQRRRSLIAKGRTIHEFDNDWTILGMKNPVIPPDPTYANGGYGINTVNNEPVINEKQPWKK